MEQIIILCMLLTIFSNPVNAAIVPKNGFRQKIIDLIYDVQLTFHDITLVIRNIDELIANESLHRNRKINRIISDMEKRDFNDGIMKSDSKSRCMESAYLRISEVNNTALNESKKCFDNENSTVWENYSACYEAKTAIVATLIEILKKCSGYDKSSFLQMITPCIEEIIPMGLGYVHDYKQLTLILKKNMVSSFEDELDRCFDNALDVIDSSAHAIKLENQRCLKNTTAI